MEKDYLLLVSLGISKHAIEIDECGLITVRQSINWRNKLIDGKIPVKLKCVYGDFDISGNNLISLDNCPQYVFGLFNCSGNLLTGLNDSPEVCNTFRCIGNPELMQLEGAPFVTGDIQGDFDKTEVAKQAVEIFKFACKTKCWSALNTWDENMKRLYEKHPAYCKRWDILEEYFPPNRGGYTGELMGIL